MSKINLIAIMACLLSFSLVHGQESAVRKDKALLIDFAQPVVGQLKAGILLPIDSHFDLIIYGKYNFNHVPNRLDYSYNFYQGNVVEYSEWYAKESGFSIGMQARRNLITEVKEYEKYLKRKRIKPQGYYGGWLDFGNSMSSTPAEQGYSWYSIEGYIPNPEVDFTTITGGVLLGFKMSLSEHLLLDIYGGLGLRNVQAEYEQPEVMRDINTRTEKYAGRMLSSTYDYTSGVARFGVQLGYKF